MNSTAASHPPAVSKSFELPYVPFELSLARTGFPGRTALRTIFRPDKILEQPSALIILSGGANQSCRLRIFATLARTQSGNGVALGTARQWRLAASSPLSPVRLTGSAAVALTLSRT